MNLKMKICFGFDIVIEMFLLFVSDFWFFGGEL